MIAQAQERYPLGYCFRDRAAALEAFTKRYGTPKDSLDLDYYAKEGRRLGDLKAKAEGRIDRQPAEQERRVSPAPRPAAGQEELPLGMEQPKASKAKAVQFTYGGSAEDRPGAPGPVEEPLPDLPEGFGAAGPVCDNRTGTVPAAEAAGGSTNESGGAKMTNGQAGATPTGAAIAVAGSRAVAPSTSLEQIQSLMREKYPKASDAEIALLFYQAERAGLDPLSGQIHLVPRYNASAGKNTSTLQYGIDGLRAIADRTGNYAGNDAYLYDEGISEYQARADGRKHPLMARAVVYKVVQGLRVAFSAEAAWDSYCPQSGGLWQKFGYLMLGKCAEALALRKAFPADLSGRYEAAEMEQAASPATVRDVPAAEAPKALPEPAKAADPKSAEEVPVKDPAKDDSGAKPTPADMRALASAVRLAGTTIVAERSKRGWVNGITKSQAAQIVQDLEKVAGA